VRLAILALGIALTLTLAVGVGLTWQRRWAGVRVSAYAPADGAENVSSRAAIRITFSGPMRDQELGARLALSPSTPGRLAWEGNTLALHPSDALVAGQTYTATLHTGARGRPLTWQFRVGEPRLLYLAPDEADRLQLFVHEQGARRQLTRAAFGVWDYAVDPEGEHIAYSALRVAEHPPDWTPGRREQGPRDANGESAGLWLVDRAGEEPRLLLADPDASCTAPAWSADGRRIAYERKDLSETVIGVLSGPLTPHIWLLDPLSGDTEPFVTDGVPTPGRDPRWSPAGQRLAFYDLSAGAVQVIDFESGVRQFFDTLSGMGTWDPAGEQMVLPDLTFRGAHSADARAFLVRVDATTRAVQHLSISDVADDHTPRWSPDGEWIAFGHTALADGTLTWGAQLWLMRPDGSEAHPLVTDPGANFGAFAWRPDGGALAYVRLDIDDIADPHPELWVVAVGEGGDPVHIASGVILPAWLP
jgi:Tol biopolymer transport system component/methionine-rich copper-binding protein CopC